jgi:metal-dependent amidase/aminoacylase/carboxypeptidase family protein
MSAPADVKQKVAGAVDRLADDLEALSHKIHDNPELCFKGGDQPNIIPEYTRADFYLRALNKDYCQELLRRFTGCAEGAAAATGAGSR